MNKTVKEKCDRLEADITDYRVKAEVADISKQAAKQSINQFLVSPKGLGLAFGLGAAKELSKGDKVSSVKSIVLKRLLLHILPF